MSEITDVERKKMLMMKNTGNEGRYLVVDFGDAEYEYCLPMALVELFKTRKSRKGTGDVTGQVESPADYLRKGVKYSSKKAVLK